MEKRRVGFSRGPLGSYDPSIHKDRLFFAEDTGQLLLDGSCYGSLPSVKVSMLSNLDSNDIPIGEDVGCGGIISASGTVGEALAGFDDSLTWQLYGNASVADDRVRFALSDSTEVGEPGTIAFNADSHTISVDGIKFGGVDRQGRDISENYVSKRRLREVLAAFAEVLGLDNSQRMRLKKLLSEI